MKISDRLRLVREHLSLTQPGAATKFGIPLGTYKQYEKGPSEPGAGALRGLAEGGVNINWLLTGEGEMLLSDQADDKASTTPNEIDLELILQVSEWLSRFDFDGSGPSRWNFGYYTALIYLRVKSVSEEDRIESIDSAIKELNLILLDQYVEAHERALTGMRNRNTTPLDILENFEMQLNDCKSFLGSSLGKFAGRELSPGSELEAEFLNGLVLSDGNDQK